MNGPLLSLAQRCRPIELLVLDVDGVLTDGGIIHGAGEPNWVGEWKQFHVRDGSGLRVWREAGKSTALLTGRTSRAVQVRAAELGITTIVQGAADKGTAFEELLAEMGYRPEQAVCVGDDVADVALFRRCGLA